MTGEEIGHYMLLLCHQWMRGSIPCEPFRIAIIARGNVSDHVLSKFTVGTDGKMRNSRLEIVRQKSDEFREKQAEISRLGVEARNRNRTDRSEKHNPPVNRTYNHGSTDGLTGGLTDGEPIGKPLQSPVSSLQSPNSGLRTPVPPNPQIPAIGELLAGGDPPASPVVGKGLIQLRVEKLFNRRESTAFNAAEKKAFRLCRSLLEATDEAEWVAVEAYHGATVPTFKRTSLSVLLNHWATEIDRAKAWIAGGRKPEGGNGNSRPQFIPEPHNKTNVPLKSL